MNNEIEQLRAELEEGREERNRLRARINELHAELVNAYTSMNMETVERAIQTVYRGVQGLHSAILRTDADMSAIRGRMQDPWFKLYERHRDALRRVVECYQPGDPIREEILREFPNLLTPEGEAF